MVQNARNATPPTIPATIPATVPIFIAFFFEVALESKGVPKDGG